MVCFKNGKVLVLSAAGGIYAFHEIVFEVNMNFEIVSHLQVLFSL